MKSLSIFKTALGILLKDKAVLALSLLPILIGFVGFYFLFDFMFGDLKSWAIAQAGLTSSPESFWEKNALRTPPDSH